MASQTPNGQTPGGETPNGGYEFPGPKLLSWSWSWWRVLVGYWNAVRPTWFAVAIMLGISTAILSAEQMRDLLEYSVDRQAQGGGVRWPLVWLYGEAILLSLTAWYFSRAVLLLYYPHTAEAPKAMLLRQWLPRTLGFITPLSVSIAFFMRGAYAFEPGKLSGGPLEWAQTDFVILWAHGVGFFIVFLLLAMFYIHRRRLGLRETEKGKPYDHRDDLPAGTWVILLALLGHTVALWAWFAAEPVSASRLVGAGGIVFAAAAAWLAVGTLLISAVSRRGGPPIIALLVVVAAIFSLWNDNHLLKPAFAPDAAPERAPYEAHAWRWILDRQDAICIDDACERMDAPPYPVVFVAAEGGGIRAAYVAASALAALEDRTECAFSEHLFGAAGVSGGSLGIASFLAARAELKGLACDGDSAAAKGDLDQSEQKRPSFLDRVDRHLSQDHLSPALSGLLFRDLTLRFSPLPTPIISQWWDRAKFIEASWSQGWAASAAPGEPGDAFDRDLTSAAAAAAPDGLTGPVAVFTTVSVKTGRQWAVSNVNIDRADWDRRRDLMRILDGSLSLAEAAHMSARFTYVSPAATAEWTDCVRRDASGREIAVIDLSQADCEALAALDESVDRIKRRDRFVDGAYFENSGAVALERMMQAFERVASLTCRADRETLDMPIDVYKSLGEDMVAKAKAAPCLSHRLDLVTLVIDADPVERVKDEDVWGFSRATIAQIETAMSFESFLSETSAPIAALAATREARGAEAIEDLVFALRARRERFAQRAALVDRDQTSQTVQQREIVRWRAGDPRPRPVQTTPAKSVDADQVQAAYALYAPGPGAVGTCESLEPFFENGWFETHIVVDEGDRERKRVPLGWLLASSSRLTIQDSIEVDCGLKGLTAAIKRAR